MWAFSDDLVFLALEDLAGLGVDIHQPAILVEEHDADDGGIEDRPVSECALFVEPLLVAVVGHVFFGAYDLCGMTILIAAEHGEHDDIVSPFLIEFCILGLQVDGDLLLMSVAFWLTGGKFVESVLQEEEVFGAVALGKVGGGVDVGYLAVLVAPCELIGLYVVGPHVNLACLEYE